MGVRDSNGGSAEVREATAEARERERHLRAVLRAVRNVNRIMLEENDPQRLIQRACDNLTGTLGYHNVWIALLDEASTRAATTASSGFDGSFKTMRKRLGRGEFPAPMRRALVGDELVVVGDPPRECADCPLADAYAGRTGLTRRLACRNRVYGVLSVSLPAAFAEDAEARDVFTELADDLGFALHKIESRARRHRLEHVVATLPHPMAFISRDHRYLAVNDAYARLYSTDPRRIVGRSIVEFLGTEAFQARVKPPLDRCLAGETVSYEIRADYPGKGECWMRMQCWPYRDENGEIAGVVSHGLDVTERKKAEERLRESEDKFYKAFRFSPVVMSISTLDDGVFLDVNEQFLKLMEFEREEVVGRKAADLGMWRKVDRQEIVSEIETRGFAHRREIELTTKSGKEISLLWLGDVVRINNRNCLIASGYDLTQIKEAEKALQIKDRAIESSINALAMADLEGRLTYANPAFLELWGYDDKQEVLGKPAVEFWHVEEDAAEIVEALYREGRWSGELSAKSKQGDLFDVQLLANMVVDESGNPLCMMASFVDVTQRKRAEEKLRHLQKAESLARMAGAIAHHYNNLMTVVSGNLEIAMEDVPADANLLRNLSHAMDASRRASDLSAKMLVYLGQSIGRSETLDLSEICHRHLRSLRADLPSNATLYARLPARGPFVNADAAQIRQVLENLVANAAESMEGRGGVVTLSLETVSRGDIPAFRRFPVDCGPREGGYACLKVADTGCGIAERDVEKIFDPFFSTRFTGRGMGLAVVLGIVKSYGGCLVVDSEPGRGSVFRVYLPLARGMP